MTFNFLDGFSKATYILI